MTLNYDHRNRKSPIKITQERRQQFVPQPGFGRSSSRFGFDELNPNPGVGSYETNVGTLLRRTPSLSSKGYGNSFVSKSPKIAPFIDLGNPGPADYDIPSFTQSPKYKQRPSTSFIQSGDGKRVPFAPPNDYPGPSDYHINYFPGKSPLLIHKKSATFESVTDRNSFFDQVSPSPPPGKYRIERADKIYKSASGDINFAKSSREERFNHIGRDNHVPGPHTYFQTPVQYSPGKSVHGQDNTNRSPPRSPSRGVDSQHSLHEGSITDDHTVKSLRSVGGQHRGKLLGKQNERAAPMQTFGADKDRFKNSTFGRLDLIAEIPGPGSYNLCHDGPIDVMLRRSERASTASATGSAIRSVTPEYWLQCCS